MIVKNSSSGSATFIWDNELTSMNQKLCGAANCENFGREIMTNKIFDSYFDFIYKCKNVLSTEQYESNCEYYERNFKRFLPPDKEAKILDLGCGVGFFLYYLKKKGYKNYLGIDISSNQIEFCKTNVTDKVINADVFEFLREFFHSLQDIMISLMSVDLQRLAFIRY